jgi:SAM-dependent methyltransferase
VRGRIAGDAGRTLNEGRIGIGWRRSAAPAAEGAGMTQKETVTGPLSKSPRVTAVASLPVATIVAAYRRRLAIEVAAYFEGVSELALLRDDDSGLLFFHPPTPGPETLYAELSARFDWYHPRAKREFEIARSRIRPTDDVLEIGAGFGFFEVGTVCRSYTGLETNQAAVRAAAQRGLQLLNKDARLLAVERPESFDVVCSFQVLEHVADPLSFLGAAIALTRPGGRIILSTPSADGFIAQSRHVLNVPPHHVTWWPDKTWHWVKEALGLKSLTLLSNGPREQLLDWSRTLAVNGLSQILGVKLHPILDESAAYQRLEWLAEQSAQIIAAGARTDQELPARGHTVIAVFEK